MISRDMQETMSRFAKIERLTEEILTLRQEMVEFDRKRNYNRECLGAFRRGEIQPNNKLWMSFGGMQGIMVKMPRKNLVSMLEGEQVKLNELYDKNRGVIKGKIKELNSLSPDLLASDMDPYVMELLLKEQKPAKNKSSSAIAEDSDENENSD
ncbi:hypothetical protein FGO68_gene7849 [Halteria grandinella]|uniref:P53 and DNA damage-regulated protein 1 n=1 Tax=Halteria grandinella TaxID=5974 RepID=A0A8J8SYR5_HALGN|nr:hypothetical protein FGO68_gene7849 [Halteria grandinella]